MRNVCSKIHLKRLAGAAFLFAALVLFGAGTTSAAELRVSWASNIESDLGGYRLRYGTQPGVYTTIEPLAATATTYFADNFDPGQTYYFSLVAIDLSGNVSAPSAEVSARIPSSLRPVPTLDSIIELRLSPCGCVAIIFAV